MTENDFLENIARRLGRPSAEPLQTVPERTEMGAPEFWNKHVLSVDSCVEQFTQSLNALGGAVYFCSSIDAVLKQIAHLVSVLAPTSISTWALTEYEEVGLAASDIEQVLGNYKLYEWGKCTLDEVANADVGLTGCTAGIADTGTLVMAAGPGRGRSVCVLPRVHIAILPLSKLYTKLGDVLKLQDINRPDMPSQIHLISGPSRSSDIENDQSIGVHGPAAVHVVLYDDRISS